MRMKDNSWTKTRNEGQNIDRDHTRYKIEKGFQKEGNASN